ncbi:hypothetical protein HJC23_005410 [Cyclotella cryptica]|uniref:PNPLA domain-containing protein n=1 Tax=Cyclotella cryptica TaxID=29204 RepID=A0ABD3P136_9STRA
MLRPSQSQILHRFSSTALPRNQASFGFSGAGFLGCYHVGVAACLHRHGILPNHNDSSVSSPAFVTGVSAGSMIAAAALAGVNPEPDGMEVVLEAARRTRELARESKTREEKGLFSFNIPLDVLTPGFSLIDQVEGPFREAMVKALGGTFSYDSNSGNAAIICDDSNNNSNDNPYDIDPELFKRRFPGGTLRIGLTDRRALWPPPIPSPIATERILDAYRYVDTYRDLDDIVAACMLSSYIPGVTGPFHLRDKVPDLLHGFFGVTNSNENSGNSVATEQPINDTVDRAGTRLRVMESLGLVKHGKTGLPTVKRKPEENSTPARHAESSNSTDFWDGGIADVFPTFDDQTVIIAPVNGVFSPNPAICPSYSSLEAEFTTSSTLEGDVSQVSATHPFGKLSPALFQTLLRSYIPTTFKHSNKARLGLNSKNVQAAIRMMFSSEDKELYEMFREGYDDAR